MLTRRDFGKWISLVFAGLSTGVANATGYPKNELLEYDSNIQSVNINTSFDIEPIFESPIYQYKEIPPLTTVEIIYKNGEIHTFESNGNKNWFKSKALRKGQKINDTTYASIKQNGPSNGNLSFHTLTVYINDLCLVIDNLRLCSIQFPLSLNSTLPVDIKENKKKIYSISVN